MLPPKAWGTKILLLATLLSPLVNAQGVETDQPIPTNNTNIPVIPTPDPTTFPTQNGTWQIIGKTGIPGVHLALLTPTKMMVINRVDTPSPYLPGGTSPFTSLYDLTTNTFSLIPFLRGQPGCATGVFLTNGTLVTTGGKIGGRNGAGEWVRSFTYNVTMDLYNRWYESYATFTTYRWYSSAALMPDGSVLFVGGSMNATIVINQTNPTYEFVPSRTPAGQPPTFLPFLMNNAPWVLYPALYVMPDGHVFIFVNQGCQLWDPYNNTVVKALPNIPGSPRSYPLTGNAVMLPLRASENWTPTIMVCGGSAVLEQTSPADPTCGRIQPMTANPQWEMDTMPYKRLMPDSVVLPTGQLILVNGAQTGFAGYGKTSTLTDVHARDPVYNPVLYDPDAPLGHRWSVLPSSTMPRMYHSTAYLLPDGRVFVAGSSSNDPVCIVQSANCTFPTLFDAEAFSPPYMLLDSPVPVITAPSAPWVIGYNTQYTFSVSGLTNYTGLSARIINTGFVTHSNHFDQRAIELDLQVTANSNNTATVSFTSPPNSSVAPPAPMFYLYVVSGAGKPSTGWQVSINPNPQSAATNNNPGSNSNNNQSSHSSSAVSFRPSSSTLRISGLCSLFAMALAIFVL